MPTPTINNLPEQRVRVSVTDAKTRKSKCFTLYGVTSTQAIRSIKRGLNLLAKQDIEAKEDKGSSAA